MLAIRQIVFGLFQCDTLLMNGDSTDSLNVGGVPVFGCTVYISTGASGGVRARVANLAGIECTAASEREALGAIVAAFKKRISELMQGDAPIPWIEPPVAAEPDEQQRFIPVHL